ncbi:MAG: hypothetical protein K0R09_1085 [Clostridiales bacterium]|jgi:hypothetical protein|nr:hypothetical protein [Clostridiales bacterium]
MRKKSKFLTFILSFIPGLGQVYLGFATRGAMFFASIFVVISVGIVLSSSYRDAEFIFFLLPVIWFAAMVDSMILADKINMYANNPGIREGDPRLLPNYEEIEKQNKKIIAMFLSVIPGVGHLYLGMQRQGIELMASFLLLFYLTDWVRFSGFMILAPIIWFYSLFDVMHKVSGERELKDEDLLSKSWFGGNSLIKNKGKAIGFVLIFIGAFVLINRMIIPTLQTYFNFNLSYNFQTVVVALLFILGGIKLITSNKKDIIESQEEIA